MYGLSKSTDSLTLVNKGFMHVNLFYSTIDGKELKLFRDKLIYRKIKQKKMISSDTMLILASISH